jgi:hypothetical protein
MSLKSDTPGSSRSPADVVGGWLSDSRAMLTAAENRDYDLFRKHYLSGQKAFMEIKGIVSSGRKKDLLSLGEMFESAVSAWGGLADLSSVWLKEMKTELDRSRDQRKKNQRITGVYNYKTGKTGVNLKMKSK